MPQYNRAGRHSLPQNNLTPQEVLAGLGMADQSMYEPWPVSGGAHDFISIAPSRFHGCAVAVDQTVWCWGDSPANGFSVATLDPVIVDNGRKFVTVITGLRYTCALDSSAQVWSWGKA